MNDSNNEPHAVNHPHSLSGPEVTQRLGSGPDGLSEAEVARRLSSVGPNRLPDGVKAGFLRRFFTHFNDTLIYILIGAAIITAALGHWIDTLVIIAVVVINAIIG
jgi:magnesium-transporting ATPase (P-type)